MRRRELWGLGLWFLLACGDDGAPVDPTTTTTGTSTTMPDPSGSTSVADDTSTTAPALPGPCADPIAPALLPTFRLTTADGRLHDALGRDVVLRGLNTGGRSKFAPFIPFEVDDPTDLDQVRAEADVYFGRLAAWGLDTVRMPFSWEALEPTPGRYDLDYRARYRTMVDSAGALGLRVIVDFHQDVYASPFCGDGFPPWSVPTLDPPEPTLDCPEWFVGYFADDDVQESFDRFWADTDGLQGPFVEMWISMAEAVVDHPAVVGFEPMNEPGWGTADDLDEFKQQVLVPWYTAMSLSLSVVAPDVLVFYDGPASDSSGGGSHFRPTGSSFVYAPHLYDASILLGDAWNGVDPTPILDSAADFGQVEAVPLLLGEFGFSHGARGGNEWLSLVMDAVDARRMSATLWEYSTSPDLWNAEDLSVVEPGGTERAILDAYVRPWVRAVAGDAISARWDTEAEVLEASWTAAEGITEVVIPSRRFPEGPAAIELTGEGACFTWDPERSELRVSAPAGTAVSLQVQ